MDALDIALAILKFIGIVATGAFALIAVIYDFKDENHELTRAGWVGICGVITAGLLSIIFHTAEVLKARQDADEASKKAMDDLAKSRQLLNSVSKTTKTSEELLHQVRRSLELIDINDLRFGFCLTFSIDDPAFVAYKTRLEAKYAELENELDNTGKRFALNLDDNLRFLRLPSARKGDQSRHILIVQSRSTLWPDPERPGEKSAARILNLCGMCLEFGNPSHPKPSYGMEMIIGGTLDGSPGPEGLQPIDATIQYNSEDRTLALYARGAESLHMDEPTNEFLSVVDFEGAKVRITLVNGDEHTRLVPSISLRSLTVSCGEKLRSVTGCQDARKVESEDGLTFLGTLSRN